MSTKQTECNQPDSPKREAYQPPTVTQYGALRDLTHGEGGTVQDTAPKTGSRV